MRKRIASLIFLVFAAFSLKSLATTPSPELKKTIGSVHFKQKWTVQPFFDSFELLSPEKVPPSISKKGEPIASMIVGLSPDKVQGDMNLEKILQKEKDRVLNELRIENPTDQPSGKYRPPVASSHVKVGQATVGVLQYVSFGEKADPAGIAQNINQILFVKGDQLFNVVLIDLGTANPNKILSDQMELVKALLKSPL